MNSKALIVKVLLFVNGIFAFIMLLSYLSPYIKPTSCWPFVFLALAYPLLFWINFGFLLLWAVLRKKFFLISLVVIIVGFNHITNYISLANPSRSTPDQGTFIKALTYNVRNFDFYSSPSINKLNFINRENIFDFLAKENFDVVFFQEFIHDKNQRFKTIDTLKQLIRANNIHFEQYRPNNKALQFGLATFSSYPIVGKGRISFPTATANLGIYTDVLLNRDTVRLYNIHFESIGLSKEDLLFFDSVLSTGQENEKMDYGVNTKRILRRIKAAALKRTIQAQEVSEHVRQCPYPVMLGGDFNDTPFSYAYRQVARHLNDAFKSGRAMGGSTHVWKYPSFRIDFLMYSNHFTAYNYNRGNQKYSDHFPVSVIFEQKNHHTTIE